jgi:VCBS repeat protein/HYDIN/CFA65/VesB family protein
VAVADFDGDGKLDVAATSAGNGLFVFLGKGDGTFKPGMLTTLPTTTKTLVTVGDFNGDHKPDIALASGGGPGRMWVMLGKGDGTFGGPGASLAGANAPSTIVAADVNGDGKLDLVVSGDGFGDGTVIALGNGDGSFQTPAAGLPTGGQLAVADLNGDGKLDLVLNPRDGTIRVFLGNGDGTFAVKHTYYDGFGGGSPSILIADFNGDGKLDVASNNFILFGSGDGSLQSNVAFLPNIPGFPLLGSAASGDFNRDGSTDIGVVAGGSNVLILLNDGTGKFVAAHNYPMVLPATAFIDWLATADLNHDGKLDLLFITFDVSTGISNLSTMLGNGDGTFAAPIEVIPGIPVIAPGSVPAKVTTTSVADFNGDHIPDLAVTSQTGLMIFLGKGDGTFGSPTTFFAGSGPNSMVTGDFNNDGNIDVAIGSSAGLAILLGKGDGTFQPAAFSNSGTFIVGATADLRSNGKLDLITPGVISILLGNGDGTFQAPGAPVLGLIDGEPFVTVADVNGDGKPDLIASRGINVFLGNGDGTFGAPVGIVGGTAFGPGSNFILVTDFNGDGRPDLVFDLNTELVPLEGLATYLNVAGPVKPDFVMQSSPLLPAVVKPGSSTTTTVSVASANGFSATVALSCLGLPGGATCNFAPSSVPGGSGMSTLTISTAASTPQATYFVTIVGTSTSLTHQRLLTLEVSTSAAVTTATVVPGTLSFSALPVGTASAAQSVQLTNTGSADLNISGISVTGTNKGDFAQTSSCPSLLSVGSGCQIFVTFTPTGMGGRSASLSISDNATGSPQMLTLTGSGPDFSVVPPASSTATVTPGQTATYMISLAPVAGFSQSVVLTCSGAPAKSTCSVSPSTIALSGTSSPTATVTVSTTASSQVFPPGGFDDRKMTYRPILFVLALAGVIIVIAVYLRRKDQRLRWVPVLAFGTLVCIGLTMTSCGGGSSGGGGGGGGTTGTPAGSYTITVSASATSGSTTLTHTTQLTMVVQ